MFIFNNECGERKENRRDHYKNIETEGNEENLGFEFFIQKD